MCEFLIKELAAATFILNLSIHNTFFFILYINDISYASKLTESLIFADNTSIFY